VLPFSPSTCPGGGLEATKGSVRRQNGTDRRSLEPRICGGARHDQLSPKISNAYTYSSIRTGKRCTFHCRIRKLKSAAKLFFFSSISPDCFSTNRKISTCPHRTFIRILLVWRAQSHAATAPPSTGSNVTLLDRRKPKSLSWPHANTTFTQHTYIRWCCIDPSNAPMFLGREAANGNLMVGGINRSANAFPHSVRTQECTDTAKAHWIVVRRLRSALYRSYLRVRVPPTAHSLTRPKETPDCVAAEATSAS